MSTARDDLAEMLTAALPTYTVIRWMRTLDRVAGPTLMLNRSSARHSGTKGIRENTFELLVLDKGQTKTEDLLDASLDVVLAALNGMHVVRWDSAEWQVLDDTFPCYKITLTMQTADDN